MGGRVSA